MRKLSTSVCIIAASLSMSGCFSQSPCDDPGAKSLIIGQSKVASFKTAQLSSKDSFTSCEAKVTIKGPTNASLNNLDHDSLVGEAAQTSVRNLKVLGATIANLDEWPIDVELVTRYTIEEGRGLRDVSLPAEEQFALQTAIDRSSLNVDEPAARKAGFITVEEFREHRARRTEAEHLMREGRVNLSQSMDRVRELKKQYDSAKSVVDQAKPKAATYLADVFEMDSMIRNSLTFQGGGAFSVEQFGLSVEKDQLVFSGEIQNLKDIPISEITFRSILWSEQSGEFSLPRQTYTFLQPIDGFGSAEITIAVPIDSEYQEAYSLSLIQGGVFYATSIEPEDGDRNFEPWLDPRQAIVTIQREASEATRSLVSIVEQMHEVEDAITTARKSIEYAAEELRQLEMERPSTSHL